MKAFRSVAPNMTRPSKLLASRSAALCGRLVLVVLAVAAAGLSQVAAAPPQANPTAVAVKEFGDRTKAYVDVQKKLEGALPPLKTTQEPPEIEEHRSALAAAIINARQTAKRGDMFGTAEAMIKHIIHEDAQNRSRRTAYAQLEEAPKRDPWMVNQEYPEKQPLATFPPLLLLKLPRLPEGLEYRFMGRDMILRDTKANIVVDFINEAVPTVQKNIAPKKK